MDLVTLIIATFLLVIVYYWFFRTKTHLPPFPARPLPIVGNLLSMKADTRTLFRNWQKQYGDMFSLYLGGTHVVVLNGYDLIKEALVVKGDVCSNRPQYFFDVATGIPDKGIIFTSGNYWKEQRSVTVSILRSLGMGTNVLAEKIMDERIAFHEYLTSLRGKPTNIQVMLYISVSNVIFSILTSQRFEYADKEFQNMMQTLMSLVAEQQSVSLVNFMPWLQYLPGDFFKAKKLAANAHKLLLMLAKLLEDKKRDVSDIMDIDNFIDAYIVAMNKQVKAGVPTFLDEDSLKKIMLQLFGAGTETTSTTIYWCVLYMIIYPNIQEKVYQEIKNKVGTDQAPTMQDKNELPYLNAVIYETQRIGSIVPLAITHTCSERVTIRGYTLLKGTSIIPNIDSVLHDTTTWGDDALSFRPERFIDDNGKLKTPEQFIPFGVGRRICLGEALAKMELFLFLSSMFQRFQFLASDDSNLPSTDYVLGIVASPKPYKLIALERK